MSTVSALPEALVLKTSASHCARTTFTSSTAIPPTRKGQQSRLGVLGGDTAGFPNGRRPADDVVDIELRVAMGVLCTLSIGGCTPAQAPAGGLRYTDGAFIFDGFFAEDFPYLRAPLKGSPNDDNAIKKRGPGR